MFTLFLVCAVLGGSVFVAQFVLAVIGFGAEGLDLDMIDDVPADVPDSFDSFDSPTDVMDHGSTFLFGVLSFRTVVAALAFFGLAGMAAMEADQNGFVSLVIATCAGLAALYGVHFLMRMLFQLRHDGTVRIEQSVGLGGTVYLPIPENNSGSGKVQLKLQERICEYAAMTSETERLDTGTPIVVTEVINSAMLRVERIRDKAAKPAVETSEV